MQRRNIVLIGMPGAGKSTIGVLLAKALGKSFIDTDLLIQARENNLLQKIIDDRGVNYFFKVEEEVVLGVQTENAVIATGGSVVYSDKAINHLKQYGIILYLKLSYPEIEARIKNMASRGIVIGKGQSLHDLYRERVPLYERNAELTVDCTGKSIEESVHTVQTNLNRFLISWED